jgi:hypothetical protein
VFTIEMVRKGVVELWETMTEDERLAFSKKCHVNKRVLQYFTEGTVMKLFEHTEGHTEWIANRVGYVLFTGQRYPRG